MLLACQLPIYFRLDKGNLVARAICFLCKLQTQAKLAENRSDLDKLQASCEQQLQQKDSQVQSLNHRLMDSEGLCASLRSTLTSREGQLAAVKNQLSMKTRELDVLHQALDDKQFELESTKNKGMDLLTFQGESISPSELVREMLCHAKLTAGLAANSSLLEADRLSASACHHYCRPVPQQKTQLT